MTDYCNASEVGVLILSRPKTLSADSTLNLLNHTLRKWLYRSSRGVKPFLDQLFGPSLRRGKASGAQSAEKKEERLFMSRAENPSTQCIRVQEEGLETWF
jgi:hypothetical protein